MEQGYNQKVNIVEKLLQKRRRSRLVYMLLFFASGYPQVGIAQPSFGEPHTFVYSRKCAFHEGVFGERYDRHRFPGA